MKDEIKIGDQIFIEGNGGFAPCYGWEKVIGIERRFDEITGEAYQLLETGGSKYRGDTGECVEGARAYYFDRSQGIRREVKE
jgi:hypothetical protein